jgi:hypothetical protein
VPPAELLPMLSEPYLLNHRLPAARTNLYRNLPVPLAILYMSFHRMSKFYFQEKIRNNDFISTHLNNSQDNLCLFLVVPF